VFDKNRQRLERQFMLFERRIPSWAARLLARLRTRRAMLVRIPLALLFVAGGVLSFLPVLGIWMLPLGLFLLAVDIPFLRGPLGHASVRGRYWWGRRQRRRLARLQDQEGDT